MAIIKYLKLSRVTSFLLTGVTFLLLTACSTAPKAELKTVFFPPLPDEPRIQYLMSFNSNGFLTKEKGSFRLIVTGEEKEDADITIDKPLGIAVHNGVLYVCDMHQQTVFMIDANKKTFESLRGNRGPGALKKPAHVAVDADGTIYVSDVVRKEIMIYDAAGDFIRAIGRSLDMKPFAVALDASHIYVLDGFNMKVKVLDKNTYELIKEFGTGTTPDDTIWRPFNMTRDSKGNLYITNIGTCKVLKFDVDGHALHAFGQQGDAPGMFARPRGIAVDDADRIWVVDAAFQNVQIFNQEGRLLLNFGDPGLTKGSMNIPAGIAITKDRMEYFRKFADPDFDVEQLIFITNQSGYDLVSVYAFGTLKKGSALRSSAIPAKPAAPAKPAVPAVPIIEQESGKPDDSVKPVKPAESVKPDGSKKPAESDEMTEPSDGEKPGAAPAK
jgi:hypothetical protein